MDEAKVKMEPNDRKKPLHPMAEEVMKMIRECNLECETPQVVANLTCAAENMAIELLKNAAFYTSQVTNTDRVPGESKPMTPAILSKEDIEVAIKLRNETDVQLPNEDALIDAAVAVNDNPLVIREKFGIPLPKDNLGNSNYQLHNKNRVKMEGERVHARPYYACIVPYKNYKHPLRMPNPNSGEPMRITIMPRYGMMPSRYGQSLIKRPYDQRYE